MTFLFRGSTTRTLSGCGDLPRWAPPAVLQDARASSLSVNELIALGQANRNVGVSQATLVKHNLCLTKFFRRLVATRAIPGNPMIAMGKVKKDLVTDLKRGKKAKRFLEEAELPKIFDPEHFPRGQENGLTGGGARF
ncbi:hypothetical protein [Stenotrophomonas rhizophila]|uniref:hypothetical protein n=1 Tax=Stenotrophomonas rhizophila TaxID=216778 RepID=UPI0028A8B932|nr:hypothetical protein [Stenotrophomonas rhizophila]